MKYRVVPDTPAFPTGGRFRRGSGFSSGVRTFFKRQETIMTECKENMEHSEKPECKANESAQCGCAAEEAARAAEAAPETPEKEEETIESLVAKLELAESKVVEQYDLYVRAMAEMENVRRRCAEDVQKARKFGIEKFAENLLPVVDSLEKALEVTADQEADPVREGMEATYRQFIHALDVSGMKPIDPKGEAFDPHKHQAIAMVPAPEGVASGCVVEVFQKGWSIVDRVLRPAMVSVAQ